METIALIGAISALGYYFGDKNRVKYDVNIDDSIPPIEKPVSSNIYNSNMSESANDQVLRMSLQNYKESNEPSVFGVLPPIYNSYSAVGNPSLFNNSSNNDTLKEITNMNSISRNSDINTGPQPLLQDRPMFKPILNNDNSNIDPFSNFNQTVTENKNQISLLTGKPIEEKHDNMIPFFGGNVRQNVDSFANVSKLDNYTGNTSTFFHKKEPLQRFEQYSQDIHGTPALTDNIDMSRFIASRFKENEKPFYEERIAAPISFTENNPVTQAATSYPTIDELRTKNKPQISYKAKINAGKPLYNARGQQGNVAKNRVDSSFILGETRLFKGPGQIVGNMSNKNYDQIQPTSRQNQNLEYYGSANNSEHLNSTQKISQFDNSSEFASLLQESKRNQFNVRSNTKRNLTGSSSTNDYGKESMNPPSVERESTSKFHTLNVNQSAKGNILTLQDNAKNTIKETTVELVDSGRNILSTVFNADSNTGLTQWDPKTTNKQTLMYETKGQANKKDGMGYVVANYDAKVTNKQTTHSEYSGTANSINKDNMIYSTYKNPIKVRNAVHINDYKGTGIIPVSDAENRDKYYNANISIIKESTLKGERPSGTNSSLGKISSGEGLVGTIKSNDNLLLKEKVNTRQENINNINNNIPTTNQLGVSTNQKKHTQNDLFSSNINDRNNRYNGDLITKQLSQNPYYNLK